MSSPLLVLAAVFVAHLLATLSPGPNVLLVMHTALQHGRRAGVLAGLGIATGAALWCAAVLLGLSLLLQRFEALSMGLRIAGAAYLFWLGLRLWQGATLDTFGMAPALSRGGAQAFTRGLLTNLSNPKALLFYGSIFAALLAPGLPLWLRLAAVAIVVADSAAWHVALACLFSTAGAREVYRRAKPAIDRTAAVALAALGLWLALSG